MLLEHADRILAAVQEAESAVAAVKGTVGATATLAALPSTVARIVAPALTGLGSHHPQLTVTCLITDQAQLRELTLGAVDVVLGQRYHHLPDATATRHTGTANPTTAAVATALRTAAREHRTPSLPPA
ncbi:hypothetical protein [Streptomyces luteogriseus]|uniref:hypothetical protein n=1 Tax=Streptomyces luteogriseus TaxID=68233 RepID=UPI00378A30EE